MAPNPRVVSGIVAAVAIAASMAMGFEGNVPTTYMDRLPLNPTPTACMGHTGPDVAIGVTYTKEQCDSWLKQDMAAANDIVHRCIRVPMTIGQEAALTDAAYNIGPNVVCGSTLQRKANAGDWAGACAELSRWVNAGGRRVEGLVRRRAAERALCEGRQ